MKSFEDHILIHMNNSISKSIDPEEMLGGFFSASSSGAGEDTDSIFNDLAEKYKDVVTFVRMDVDEMTDAVQQFGIQTTPTFVLVKHGQEVDRLVGGDWKELQRKIEKHIPMKLEP